MAPEISIKQHFQNRLSEILSDCPRENAAIFFLGFDAWQSRIIMEHELALSIPGTEWFDEDGYLDLKSVDDAAKKTILSICTNEGVVLGLYEHLARSAGSLSDLYDGEIIVVCNNLFERDSRYPSCVSKTQLNAFKQYMDRPDRETPEGAELAAKYYADIAEFADEYLVAPIQYSDELGYRQIEFFKELDDVEYATETSLTTIAVPSSDYTNYRLRLCSGVASPACFLVDKNADSDRGKLLDLPATARLLAEIGVNHDIVREGCLKAKAEDGNELLPYLRKYWNAGDSFRMLKFYKNPDISPEQVVISQGAIAQHIVKQALIAMTSENSFQDTFVTAPTGAGKSVLFQIPAIFLAEEKQAVTLVIEPTKALMVDQVSALRSRGVRYATTLNTDITYAERLEEIQRFKDGERSIVYLSPELLLSCNITDIIGERPLGLVVIDEAHTVSLWGKDFRSDYWFLGDYISKLRKLGTRFPVMCLTATAVYGGVDDVVNEVCAELELMRPKLYIGNVRRDDISFNINVLSKADHPGPIDVVKQEIAAAKISDYVRANRHALIYCPFKSHANHILDFYLGTPGADSHKVLKYHAGLDQAYRESAQRRFTSGACRALICTKAFGMGIDVNDITDVYHYAPTGNLADYIQEIGRGARRADVRAIASIDFFPTDSRYYAQLYSMSSLRLKQLREIMKKLYSIYLKSTPRKQNFLISTDSFTYLFGDGSDPVNKTKSALMMIAKDLEKKYGYPVVVVKSRPTYTKNYVCIPDGMVDSFMKRYGHYAHRVFKKSKKNLNLRNKSKFASEVSVSDIGDTYEIDMAKIWEDHFYERTFNQFKWDFYHGDIIPSNGGLHPSSRQRLEIKYSEDFEIVAEKFHRYMDAIETAFSTFRTEGHEFTAKEFKNKVTSILQEPAPFTEFIEQVLAAFAKTPSNFMSGKREPTSTIKVLTKKQNSKTPEPRYAARDKAFINISNKFDRQLQQCRPWTENNSFIVYLSRDKQTREEFDLATLLELFGLATYEARGGEDAEIFIRLNDPNKVQALANDPRYKNSELDRLNSRHKNSRQIITNFFLSEIADDLRWDLIEAYFLGEDDYVAEVLGLSSTDGKLKRVATKSNASRKKKEGLEAKLATEGMSLADRSFSEIWAYVKEDCSSDWEVNCLSDLASLTESGSFEKPRYDVELEIPSVDERIPCSLAWPEKKVLLFLDEDADAYERAVSTDWTSFLLTPEFEASELVDAIRS